MRLTPERAPATALAALAAVAMFAATAAGRASPSGEVPQAAPAPDPAPPAAAPAHHPSLATGWARPRSAGVTLHRAPDPAQPPSTTLATTRTAGRVLAVRHGADGRVWVRLSFPDRSGGFAAGDEVLRAPAPRMLSARTHRAIETARAALGPSSAVIVRDHLGRPLLRSGTGRPLTLASVTKLGTMAAALAVLPVTRGTARAVLGSSDNRAAQALSTRLGRGDRAAGARATRDAVAALGAPMRLTDGSGLSPANRASAAAVSDLLLAMRDQRGFPLFLDGLAVAGRSGTLAARMRGTSATGRVRAKTGSLFDTPTSTLAGYVWPAGLGMRADRALIVVILSNGIHPERARPRQDTIMEALTAPGAVESSSPAATPRSPGAGTPSPIAGPG